MNHLRDKIREIIIGARTLLHDISQHVYHWGHKDKSTMVTLHLKAKTLYPQNSHPKEWEVMCFEYDGVLYLARIHKIHPEMTRLPASLFHLPIQTYLCPLFSQKNQVQSTSQTKHTDGHIQCQCPQRILSEKKDSKSKTEILRDTDGCQSENIESCEKSPLGGANNDKHSNLCLEWKAQSQQRLGSQKTTCHSECWACHNITIDL